MHNNFFFDGLSFNYGMHGHVSDATRSTETSLERALQEKRIMLEQNEFSRKRIEVGRSIETEGGQGNHIHTFILNLTCNSRVSGGS